MTEMHRWTRLDEVRAYVAMSRYEGVTCPACDQYVRVYRRRITSATARALILMHRGGSRNGAWVHLPTLLQRKQADEAKARYWGLIEDKPETRDDGSDRAGWWRLTQQGAAFVRAEYEVPRYALVYNGRLLGLEGPLTGIRECLGTRFNYNDLMRGV